VASCRTVGKTGTGCGGRNPGGGQDVPLSPPLPGPLGSDTVQVSPMEIHSQAPVALWSADHAICTLVRREGFPTIFEVRIEQPGSATEVALFDRDAEAADYAIQRRVDLCGC